MALRQAPEKPSLSAPSTPQRRPRLVAGIWQRVRQPSRLALGVAATLLLAGGGALYWLHSWVVWNQNFPVRTADLWQHAHQEIDDGEFRAAINHLDQCLDICPFHAETQFLLARTCRRAKDLAGWQSHLARAEVLQWPRAQIELERRLERAQSGDLGMVVVRLQTALESPSPDDIVIFEALAIGYMENDWVDRILDLTNFWLERHPDDWQARYYRGQALQRKPKPMEAIAELKRVLEIKPGQPEAQLALAEIYMGNDKFQEALPLFESCLEADPANPNALYGLANCQYTFLAQPDEARATLKKLLAKEPEHLMGLFLQSNLERADGAPDKALELLRRAEHVAPREPYILQNLVVVLQELNRTEEADHYQKQAKEASQSESQLYPTLMQCRTEPDNPTPRYQAGMLSLKLMRESDAAYWFQRALWIDPNHRPTHEALADYYEKHNDPQRAAHHRQKAAGKSTGASSP